MIVLLGRKYVCQSTIESQLKTGEKKPTSARQNLPTFWKYMSASACSDNLCSQNCQKSEYSLEDAATEPGRPLSFSSYGKISHKVSPVGTLKVQKQLFLKFDGELSISEADQWRGKKKPPPGSALLPPEETKRHLSPRSSSLSPVHCFNDFLKEYVEPFGKKNAARTAGRSFKRGRNGGIIIQRRERRLWFFSDRDQEQASVPTM